MLTLLIFCLNILRTAASISGAAFARMKASKSFGLTSEPKYLLRIDNFLSRLSRV